MELLLTLAMKFWQWSLLILFVIIGFIINLIDKRKTNLKFNYMVMPHLKPIPIRTKGKGFFKAIAMWLLSTRNWELVQDWKYNINKDHCQNFIAKLTNSSIFNPYFFYSYLYIFDILCELDLNLFSFVGL